MKLNGFTLINFNEADSARLNVAIRSTARRTLKFCTFYFYGVYSDSLGRQNPLATKEFKLHQ